MIRLGLSRIRLVARIHTGSRQSSKATPLSRIPLVARIHTGSRQSSKATPLETQVKRGAFISQAARP
jgi:hypothetical protein